MAFYAQIWDSCVSDALKCCSWVTGRKLGPHQQNIPARSISQRIDKRGQWSREPCSRESARIGLCSSCNGPLRKRISKEEGGNGEGTSSMTISWQEKEKDGREGIPPECKKWLGQEGENGLMLPNGKGPLWKVWPSPAAHGKMTRNHQT